ncbi:urea ABC transporter permease subunit UrtB [Selenomonas caprae]|uniref:Urea ABC transporter permease subunit UrtB n=1 Tax=Selenomonas caprae TaxID=2606905 RepID=A0A5D6WIX4_9FIRM|nr:urea ABC transporter permease subunit UrtB [Selenomonas caprae]TYZ26848.1 urea ABC transporter permease subunit UrtB [Selenomonas caprae]
MDICTIVFNGLSLSSILLLAALGLSITFGLMGIINMAHGEFIMVGAYTTYVVQNMLLPVMGDGYFFVSLLLSFLITAAFGMALEVVVIRRLYGRPTDSLLATWGISLILQQMARSIFGAPNVNVVAPSFLNGSMTLLGVSMSFKRLFILGIVLSSLVMVWFFLYHTGFGRKMRACIQNRAMAQCLGIHSSRIDCLTFALGSGLAGVAGSALTLLGSIGPTLGQNYIVDTFMVVVLGGVGKLIGCISGALIIGCSSTMFEFMSTASIAKAAVLFLVILFLQKNPQGLFALRSRALDD